MHLARKTDRRVGISTVDPTVGRRSGIQWALYVLGMICALMLMTIWIWGYALVWRLLAFLTGG
jgi:hypothetical protein